MTEPALWEPDRWQAAEAGYLDRVDALIAGHRDRRRTGAAHPVHDFLFSYYKLRPSQLRRWHPGAGIGLLAAPHRLGWRFHIPGPVAGSVVVDVAQVCADRHDSIDLATRLLRATADRAPHFGCFGLHEWAMVYRSPDRRHQAWPLRLGPDGTDAVVRAHQIRCSHFDAFRFFTPPARPRNLLQPTVTQRVQLEQPGCLHVGMDLYKWAYKLLPLVPSELVADCFELARDIRAVDMQASPYDLSELGFPPIPIETAEGKATYVARQRQFARRAQPLRGRLLDALSATTGSSPR